MTTSDARKRLAEATNPHGGCDVGTCKAEDQWRTVSCAGGGGDVEALDKAVALLRGLTSAVAGSVTLDGANYVLQARVTAAVSLLDAALAAQPAAPQPTDGGAVAARHQMLAGSHERPNGAECLCGAPWDRWNNCCAAPPQRPEGGDLEALDLALARAMSPSSWADGATVPTKTLRRARRTRKAIERGEVPGLWAAQRPEGVTVTKVPNTGDALHDFTEHLKRQRTEGVTVTEWGVRTYSEGAPPYDQQEPSEARAGLRAAEPIAQALAAVDAVARVEALVAGWEVEGEQRGPDDTLYTGGTAAMLRAALRPEGGNQ